MSVREDGGAAFPRLVPPVTNWSLEDVTSGMSLRDWFAGQALAAVIAHTDRERWAWAAERAYEVADAMLAERSKP